MTKGLVTIELETTKPAHLKLLHHTNSPRNKALSVPMMVDQERSPKEETLTGILFGKAIWGAENERKPFQRSSPQGHVSPLEPLCLQ